MSSEAESPSVGEKFANLVSLMKRLRGPNGCPWDREQTFDSIKPHTLEETYEVFDAIDRKDWSALSEELGDYLLQAVFYAQMASEENRFTIADSLDSINDKLIRRHPHIFGDETAHTASDVKQRWDEIKKTEKKDKGTQKHLDGVLKAQPALSEAQQLTRKAADVAFDWPDREQVFEKLQEEMEELRAAETPDEIEAELGDILFVLVNLARKYNVDAEQALRRTNTKFRRRFGYIEEQLQLAGKNLKSSDLEEMDQLWNEAKTSLSAD